MIKKTKVDVYVEHLYCDTCQEAMVFSGTVLDSMPPQYPYECKNGHRLTSFEIYPRKVYQEIVIGIASGEFETTTVRM